MDNETQNGTEVVRREDRAPDTYEATDRSALPTGMLQPVDDPGEIVRGREKRSRLITEALQEGRDYGSVRGIPKPFLHKPGAERLTDAFGCYPRFRILDQEVEHDRRVEWQKVGKDDEGEREVYDSGTSKGLYRYVVSCDLVHRASGVVVGNGLGSCSTMEKKYVDRPRDSENTVLKMAKKRAHVDASLSTFGLSEMFTQDDDYVRSDGDSGGKGGAPSNDPDLPDCPACGGPVWDNREKKRKGEYKSNAPDLKCRDKDCDTPIWSYEPETEPDTTDGDTSPEGRLLKAIAEYVGEKNALTVLEAYAATTRNYPDDLGQWKKVDCDRALKTIRKQGEGELWDAQAEAGLLPADQEGE